MFSARRPIGHIVSQTFCDIVEQAASPPALQIECTEILQHRTGRIVVIGHFGHLADRRNERMQWRADRSCRSCLLGGRITARCHSIFRFVRILSDNQVPRIAYVLHHVLVLRRHRFRLLLILVMVQLLVLVLLLLMLMLAGVAVVSAIMAVIAIRICAAILLEYWFGYADILLAAQSSVVHHGPADFAHRLDFIIVL